MENADAGSGKSGSSFLSIGKGGRGKGLGRTTQFLSYLLSHCIPSPTLPYSKSSPLHTWLCGDGDLGHQEAPPSAQSWLWRNPLSFSPKWLPVVCLGAAGKHTQVNSVLPGPHVTAEWYPSPWVRGTWRDPTEETQKAWWPNDGFCLLTCLLTLWESLKR